MQTFPNKRNGINQPIVVLIVGFLLFNLSGSSQITQTFICSGTTGSYNSGSVGMSGSKLDGNLQAISQTIRGWSSFDISSIPPSSTILSASIDFTTYNSANSSIINSCYGFVGTPSNMSGASLYAACASGALWNSSSWTSNSSQTKQISSLGLSFIADHLGGTINVGYVSTITSYYYIYGYGSATPPALTITYLAPSPCTGTPDPGNTLSSENPVCANTNFTLSLQNSTTGSGVTYQWYKDGSPMSGATSSTYTGSITNAANYQCLVTCSGSSVYSGVINMGVNNFLNCYCIPTYTIPCSGGHHIVNAKIQTPSDPINNSSGACLVPGLSYSDYTQSVPAATLPANSNFPPGAISMSINYAGVPEYGAVWIDFNHNSQFEISEYIPLNGGYSSTANKYIYSNPSSISIPSGIPYGLTRVRFRSSTALIESSSTSACINFANGETEDYLINFTQYCEPFPPLLGNTTSSTGLACTGTPFTLSFQNNIAGYNIGLSYQWQYSLDGNAWNNISGASNSTYTNTWIWPENSRYFRVFATCGLVGGYSNPLQLTKDSFYNCYCTAGATVNGCNTVDEYIGNVMFNTINNTSTCPASGQYSNFGSISTTVNAGSTYNASVLIPNWFNSDHVSAWIDFNHNGLFTDLGEQFDLLSGGTSGTDPFTGSISIPSNAMLGTTRMRIRVNYYATMTPCGTTSYGEVEDYSIQIIPPNVSLQIKLFLEGYYNGSAQMSRVLFNEGKETNAASANVDSVLVELHATTSPYSLIESYQGILQTNGILNCTFPYSVLNQSFYLVVKHRNTIETWSESPIAISSGTNYDFTSSANKAYGNNLKEVESGVFACYSGDINLDENIDLIDASFLENDINAFQSGYVVTDMNGDGNVDLLDAPIVESNVSDFIFSSHP